jgi:hypothetical protein
VSEELKQNIKQHPDTVAMNIPSYVLSARAKIEYGDCWSFTDIFGHMIGDTIIKGVSFSNVIVQNHVNTFSEQSWQGTMASSICSL